METRSYSQSLVASLTCFTMLPGVRVGPEGKRRGSFWPEASILTLVPPMSITRILGDLADGFGFIEAPWNCGVARQGKRGAESRKRMSRVHGRLSTGEIIGTEAKGSSLSWGYVRGHGA